MTTFVICWYFDWYFK